MKKITFLFFSTAMVFLTLTGCQNPVQAAENAAGSAKGTLTVTLPPIAAAIAAQANGAKDLARVYAYASSFTIAVQTSSGIPVVTCSGSTTPASTPVSMDIPVGSNYIVTVSIYNSNVSASIPTVTGTASGVNITTGGTTPLNVICKPYNPTFLSLGASVTTTLAANGEVYYSLSVLAGCHYTFTQTRSDLFLGLFDSTGAALDSWSMTSGPISYTATSNSTIYVGLSATNTASGSTTLTATGSQGTSTNPDSVTVGTPLTFFLGASTGTTSSSYYSFTPTATGTHLLDLGTSLATYTATLYTGTIGGTTVLPTTASVSGLVNLGTLTASTTYYLVVTNTSPNAFTFTGGSVDFMVPLATGASAYVQGTIASPGQDAWYIATVTNPSTHSLYWDDYFQGSGTYTLDIDVSAYKADLTSYFIAVDSGYTTPQVLNVTVGTVVFIKVRAFDGMSTVGTFGIKLL